MKSPIDNPGVNSEEQLDLALAAELQAALLPKKCPTDCPHQTAAAKNRMCGKIGGDFYDFIRINEEQIAIVIGDVIGHGVRASLLMSQIMGFLRSASANLSRPALIMSAINRMLIDLGNAAGTIVPCTVFYAVIDAPTGLCLFVNAGHHRPFKCNPEACTIMPFGTKNLMLGVEDFQPEEDCYTFTPGERLVMYTDGVVEAANDKDELFGDARLHEIVSANTANSAQQCVDAVFEAIDKFRGSAPQKDDETVVVVDRI